MGVVVVASRAVVVVAAPPDVVVPSPVAVVVVDRAESPPHAASASTANTARTRSTAGSYGLGIPRRWRRGTALTWDAMSPETEAVAADPTLFDKVVNLCKRRGFVFPSAEIYGGFRSTYDYGPIGVLMLRNVKQAWWRSMVQLRDDIVGLDAAILGPPAVFEASGHLANFTDPLVDCRNCQERFREDDLDDPHVCPNCGARESFTEARQFNLMFKTFAGPIEEDAAVCYLRPETAQGMFVNFMNVLTTSRKKPPFGIAQVGKSFRNEITPGNFVFRTREFEQMEMEYFVPPDEGAKWLDYWVAERFRWYTDLGIPEAKLRLRAHDADELSHYSSGTYDVEFLFPWGWGELEGIANRTDYDLTQHAKHSGERLEYFDQATGERYVPHVIEPAAGATRSMMAFLLAAYAEEEVRGEQRTVLHLHHRLAPYQVAVLPLSKNERLTPTAREVLAQVQPHWMADYDETQAIGRRYRRQDEIGTPYCVTVDFDSLEDGAVTVRERDSMAQDRVPIPGLVAYLSDRLV
jgi:glycyl-tRNA synthetase